MSNPDAVWACRARRMELSRYNFSARKVTPYPPRFTFIRDAGVIDVAAGGQGPHWHLQCCDLVQTVSQLQPS